MPTIYDKFNKTGRTEDYPSFAEWQRHNNYRSYTDYQREKGKAIAQRRAVEAERRRQQGRQEQYEKDNAPYLYRQSYANNGPLAVAGRGIARTLDTGLYNTLWFGPNLIRKGYNAVFGGPAVSLMQSVNDDRQYNQPPATPNSNQIRIGGGWKGNPVPEEDMATNPLENNSVSSNSKVNKTSNSNTQKPAVKINQGETVASVWARVTGLPWKAAKELGLSDGSYAANIEILKGLKSGQITKESIAAMRQADKSYAPYKQSVVYEEAAPAAYTAAPTIGGYETSGVVLPDSQVVDLSGMQRTDESETDEMAYGGRMPRYRIFLGY